MTRLERACEIRFCSLQYSGSLQFYMNWSVWMTHRLLADRLLLHVEYVFKEWLQQTYYGSDVTHDTQEEEVPTGHIDITEDDLEDMMDLDEEDVYDLSVLSQLILEQPVNSQILNSSLSTEQHQLNSLSHYHDYRDDLLNSEAEHFHEESVSSEEAVFLGAGEIVITSFITWDKYCRCD